MNSTMEPPGFPAFVPANFEMAVHLTRAELEHHLRLMAALKMFELGQISSGKAAEFVGITRVDFLHTCGRYRISVFNYPPEDAEAEIIRDLKTFSQFSAT